MAHFIEDAIMHNPKILSYSINLESINLPGYTSEERIKCINNIGKIICQKGPRIVTDFDSTTRRTSFKTANKLDRTRFFSKLQCLSN